MITFLYRELKEPLLPWNIVEKLMPFTEDSSTEENLSQIKDILQSMPACHYETLIFLLQHLRNVASYKVQ